MLPEAIRLLFTSVDPCYTDKQEYLNKSKCARPKLTKILKSVTLSHLTYY